MSTRHSPIVTGNSNHHQRNEMTDTQPTPTTTDAGIPIESDEHSLTSVRMDRSYCMIIT
jgi:hypothetical protein